MVRASGRGVARISAIGRLREKTIGRDQGVMHCAKAIRKATGRHIRLPKKQRLPCGFDAGDRSAHSLRARLRRACGRHLTSSRSGNGHLCRQWENGTF